MRLSKPSMLPGLVLLSSRAAIPGPAVLVTGQAVRWTGQGGAR